MYMKAMIAIYLKFCLHPFVCLQYFNTQFDAAIVLRISALICAWLEGLMQPMSSLPVAGRCHTGVPDPGCSPGNRCSLELMSRFSDQPTDKNTSVG